FSINIGVHILFFVNSGKRRKVKGYRFLTTISFLIKLYRQQLSYAGKNVKISIYQSAKLIFYPSHFAYF
ncbi:MAG TPA: hypothetical protein VNX40_04420, partial [Mucilaginibacter sp.]|nr:hypothetical protein [Mucilaginibacter sp.]